MNTSISKFKSTLIKKDYFLTAISEWNKTQEEIAQDIGVHPERMSLSRAFDFVIEELEDWGEAVKVCGSRILFSSEKNKNADEIWEAVRMINE